MTPRRYRARRLALMTLVCVALPTIASGQAPTAFNLMCHGWAKVRHGRQPFEEEFAVDLSKKAFCDAFTCADLTKADERTIEHDCTSHAGEPLCAHVSSTAGPFVSSDHFTFDRTTGAFERKMAGQFGDITSRPFASDYRGECTVLPFMELAPTHYSR
jgi:hypothetical protein